jgi:hypothetical protein
MSDVQCEQRGRSMGVSWSATMEAEGSGAVIPKTVRLVGRARKLIRVGTIKNPDGYEGSRRLGAPQVGAGQQRFKLVSIPGSDDTIDFFISDRFSRKSPNPVARANAFPQNLRAKRDSKLMCLTAWIVSFVRLSDLGPRFVCSACGKRGADVRPDFN